MTAATWPAWIPSQEITPPQWPVACLGPGRVGSALSRALAGLGFPIVAVGGGSAAAADRLARELETEVVVEPYSGLGERARLVLVTTPDRSLTDVARGLARSADMKQGACLVQTSATEPAEILRPAAGGRDGVLCLSFHPLKPFPDRERGLPYFKEIIIGIEGDGDARLLGHSLARLLHGYPLDVSTCDKAVYHAVGVMAFTGVMALAWAAEQVARGLELDQTFIDRGILPSMSAAVEAVKTLGLPEGLTGPISRGDAEVVSRHMMMLSERFPELVPIYREVALLNLRMVEEGGGLGEEAVERLRQALNT